MSAALSKMRAAAESIELRGDLRTHERKRVMEAFALMRQPKKLPVGIKDRKEESYRSFLVQLNKECGPQPVVVAVVGVGRTAIALMKEIDRLRFPSKIKANERNFKSSILQRIAENCEKDLSNDKTIETLPDESTQTGQSNLLESPPNEVPNSRVFELTLEDAQAIISSGQVPGRVLLVEPHSRQTLPFITITLSEEWCGYYTAQRNRIG